MRLYVMRHGPAEDHASSGRDEDRVLTTSGRDRVRDVARLLGRENELPARILTSRLARADETAEIVAVAMKAAGGNVVPETVHELAPGGDNVGLVRRAVAEAAGPTMVVGHEPDLSQLAAALLRGPLPVPMDKAMVVALDIDATSAATLRFIVEPRMPRVTHDHR